MAALQGPWPVALDVTIHHWPGPGVSVTPGFSEHVPVPLAQPAWAAVYVVRMRPPELASSERWSFVAVVAALLVKVGVAVVMVPDGDTSVAGPGGGGPGTV